VAADEAAQADGGVHADEADRGRNRTADEEAGRAGADDEHPPDAPGIGGRRPDLDPALLSQRLSRYIRAGRSCWEAAQVRQHWKELDYWLWLWHRVPGEAKLALGALLAVLLLGGGWFAADRLTTASASVADTAGESLVIETTVQQVITVREKGKTIRKVVPVVKRVYVRRKPIFRTELKYATRVVTYPGRVSTIRRLVTTVVPVVRKRVVTVNGKTRTTVQTRFVPTTRTETRVVTQTREVTNLQTVTNTQNVTGPGSTVTQSRTTTLPAQTVTTTQPAVTTTTTITTTTTNFVPTEVTTTTTTTTTTTSTVTSTTTEVSVSTTTVG
jgi:hypothetical protein